jgi:hypothetical protein
MDVFPRFERSKLIPRLLLGLGILVVTVSVAVPVFLTSEPFEYGTHVVATDPRVTKVTGKSIKTELRYSRPFRFSFGDRSGSAAMTIRSLATEGTFDVELELVKRAGAWSIERAQVYPKSGPAITVVDTKCKESCT